MARGAPVWYVVGSLLTTLAVYEIFQVTGYDKALGAFFVALVFIFTFPIAIGGWVYQDARERGWNGLFWALVSVFVPLGFLIYLIVRKPRGLETRGKVWFLVYGILFPLGYLILGLVTGFGGILLVMGVFIWMGFVIIMTAPAKDPLSP